MRSAEIPSSFTVFLFHRKDPPGAQFTRGRGRHPLGVSCKLSVAEEVLKDLPLQNKKIPLCVLKPSADFIITLEEPSWIRPVPLTVEVPSVTMDSSHWETCPVVIYLIPVQEQVTAGSQDDPSPHQLVTMPQTPLEAAMPPVLPLSSTFLVKLSSLVESINLSTVGQPPPKTTQLPKGPADASDRSPCLEDCESIPRMALEENWTVLDELLEETEREIKALMEFWENCFVDVKEDSRPEIPWISKWHLGHPLDLNDEALREDPSYNEELAEQEALQEYLKELEVQRTWAATEPAASQPRDAATSVRVKDKSPAYLGTLTSHARALTRLAKGRPPALKKPYEILSVGGEAEATGEELQAESRTPSSSSKEEEAAVLPRKRPQRNLQSQASRTGSTQRRWCSCELPETDQSSKPSGTSSSGEGQLIKPYNFRRSKRVSYIPQEEEEVEEEEEEEEEEEKGSSEDDWVPGKEGTDAEEEEEEEEDAEEGKGEESEAEREEESEADPGPPQAEPPRKKRPKAARRYQCPECDREFSNSSNMRKHLLIHRGERPYGCHACGQSYADVSNLKKHQLKHMGMPPHACPSCPKAFFVKNHLDAHLRRHLGIRPFACLECRRSFCSRVELLVHMKIHTGAKGAHRPQALWPCPKCSKSFSKRRHLRLHVQRHRNLVCEDCGEVFQVQFKFQFHRALHLRACPQCGVDYKEGHLCRATAHEAAHPGQATQKPPAAFPGGVAASWPAGSAARVGSQPWPPGLTQNTSRPSDAASTTSAKELPPLAGRGVSASQRRPLRPPTPPARDRKRAKPSAVAQKPLKPKPPVTVLQVVPLGGPVAAGLSVSKPLALPAPLSGSPGLVMLPPHSRASGAVPVLMVAPPMTAPLMVLPSEPLTVTTPARTPQPSGSHPAGGAGSQGLVLLDPATMPAGSRIILKMPGQMNILPEPAQACAACQVQFVGTHQCTKSLQELESGGEEEPKIYPLATEERTIVPLQASPVPSPCPQLNDQEPWSKSHGLYEANSQATPASGDREGDCDIICLGDVQYPEANKSGESRRGARQTKQPERHYMRSISGDEEESRSDKEGDCDVLCLGEVQYPEANKPGESQRGGRQTEQCKTHYTCSVCDKRYVYENALKKHMRWHMEVSREVVASVQREQLRRAHASPQENCSLGQQSWEVQDRSTLGAQ
ncbi:uncharacterized protein LOC143830578 isoform X2 [Paroedura picta]|uniref:uncharacterized protein LOC143830578 isoform X2 n=1 Tax=Paroedura picta TaxID=143630 RepID=UPI004055C852